MVGGLGSGTWAGMSSGSSSLNGDMVGRAASPLLQHDAWRVDKVESVGGRVGGGSKGGEDLQVGGGAGDAAVDASRARG